MATSQFDPTLAVMRGGEGVEVAMVFKAQRTISNKPVPDLMLAATQEMPSVDAGQVVLSEVRKVHVTDAETIVNALEASLPGGTLDQVLRLLLERKATYLVVNW